MIAKSNLLSVPDPFDTSMMPTRFSQSFIDWCTAYGRTIEERDLVQSVTLDLPCRVAIDGESYPAQLQGASTYGLMPSLKVRFSVDAMPSRFAASADAKFFITSVPHQLITIVEKQQIDPELYAQITKFFNRVDLLLRAESMKVTLRSIDKRDGKFVIHTVGEHLVEQHHEDPSVFIEPSTTMILEMTTGNFLPPEVEWYVFKVAAQIADVLRKPATSN